MFIKYTRRISFELVGAHENAFLRVHTIVYVNVCRCLVSMHVCAFLLYVYINHQCTTDPVYNRPSVQQTQCTTDPVYNRPSVQQTQCTTDPVYNRPSVQHTQCTTDPVYNRPSVQQTQCTTDPVYNRPHTG